MRLLAGVAVNAALLPRRAVARHSPAGPDLHRLAPGSGRPAVLRAPGGRRSRVGPGMRLGSATAAALGALVLAGAAAAHGRGATFALDYRLSLDRSTRTLAGVHVRILDGDRDLQVSVDPGVRLLVRGDLREPFLRLDAGGVWADANSPTATSDGVVSPGLHGWVRLSRGRSVVWHDHRLSPPPAGAPGPDGHFAVPIVLNGAPASIGGSFFRVARPAAWPWLAGAAAALGAVAAAVRRRTLRARLTIGLGLSGGLAALAAVTAFAVRDAPTGGVAWLQIGTGLVLGVVFGALVARLGGRARVHAAGVVGAVGAAVSLSSLSVFWHGVIISALPATLIRLLCALALIGGASGALLSFLPDFDEPLPAGRR